MINLRLVSSLLLAILASACSQKSSEIVVCGDDKVLIFDESESESTDVKVTWQWKVSDAGELVYTKGEISWWTHNIYFINPEKRLIIPDINIYKVRVIK